MIFYERPATPPLSQWIEALWYCETYPAVHRQERVLPNGRFQLVISLGDWRSPSLLAGIRSESTVMETAKMQSTIGVVFRPGGTGAFFASAADEFRNQTIALDLLWGSQAARLREKLREARTPSARLRTLQCALLGSVGPRELHPAVRYALREFPLAPSYRRVLKVSAEARLSRRRFAQLFREQVGLTPKLYCRVLRFRQIVRSAYENKEVKWADLALDCGYSDQAHLAHEFRSFSGLSPRDWLSAHRPFQNHAALE